MGNKVFVSFTGEGGCVCGGGGGGVLRGSCVTYSLCASMGVCVCV